MLADAGYYSGNPDIVERSNVENVLNMYHYLIYKQDYENTYYELNKEK